MCNPVEEHGRETAYTELNRCREVLAGTRPPEGRAWDEVLRQDARRVLAELAELPPQTKAKRWADLTPAEAGRLRRAINRARVWAAGQDPVEGQEGAA